jgi:hypothetical protein
MLTAVMDASQTCYCPQRPKGQAMRCYNWGMPRRERLCLLHSKPRCEICGHPAPRRGPPQTKWPKRSGPKPVNRQRDCTAAAIAFRLGWRNRSVKWTRRRRGEDIFYEVVCRTGFNTEALSPDEAAEDIRRAVSRLQVNGILTSDDLSVPPGVRPPSGQAIVFYGDGDDYEIVDDPGPLPRDP